MSAAAISVGPFALPTQLLILLFCAGMAALVGHLVGQRQQTSVNGTLSDMFLAAGLAARVAFVVLWFENYRSAPWSMLDIRDGGFTPWAGVLAAILVAAWQGWRRATLRGPLLFGLMAGTVIWIVSPAVLRLGDGPALSDMDEISFVTMEGTPGSLAKLAQGKPLVVNLWATWCPPCRREMPVLAAAQQQLPGVSFIFANQGESQVTVQRYLTASGLTFANVVLDPGKKLGQQLGSTALPTTLFFDTNGRLVDTHLGALSSGSLASKLKKLETPGPTLVTH